MSEERITVELTREEAEALVYGDLTTASAFLTRKAQGRAKAKIAQALASLPSSGSGRGTGK